MKPGFLVAGVAKSGTTSLFYYLDQHPEICIPKKETFFFIADNYRQQTSDEKGRRDPSRIIFTREQYDALYAKCDKGISGEVSTCYAFYHKEAIPRILETLGNIPVILIVRNPVERLISGYKYHRLLGTETLSLEEAIAAEDQRGADGYDFMWQYRKLGLYAEAVEAYRKNFSRVKIILQEDLEQHADQTMREVFEFIGVDPTYKPDTSVRYNISAPQHKNLRFRLIALIKPLLGGLLKKLISEKNRRKYLHQMRTTTKTESFRADPALISQLKEYYRRDILHLQELIHRDLSSWLQ